MTGSNWAPKLQEVQQNVVTRKQGTTWQENERIATGRKNEQLGNRLESLKSQAKQKTTSCGVGSVKQSNLRQSHCK